MKKIIFLLMLQPLIMRAQTKIINDKETTKVATVSSLASSIESTIEDSDLVITYKRPNIDIYESLVIPMSEKDKVLNGFISANKQSQVELDNGYSILLEWSGNPKRRKAILAIMYKGLSKGSILNIKEKDLIKLFNGNEK